MVQLDALSKARAANAFESLIQRLIARFYLAGVIWEADPQQVEHFREVSARKTRIGDEPDFIASLDLFPQHVGDAVRRTQTGPYQCFLWLLLISFPIDGARDSFPPGMG